MEKNDREKPGYSKGSGRNGRNIIEGSTTSGSEKKIEKEDYDDSDSEAMVRNEITRVVVYTVFYFLLYLHMLLYILAY